MVRLLFWLPTLAIVAVAVVVGLRVGPWWPLGVAIATLLTLGVGRWISRDVARLRTTNPAEAQRIADARAARVGRLLGRSMMLWLSLGVVFVVAILVAHFA